MPWYKAEIRKDHSINNGSSSIYIQRFEAENMEAAQEHCQKELEEYITTTKNSSWMASYNYGPPYIAELQECLNPEDEEIERKKRVSQMRAEEAAQEDHIRKNPQLDHDKIRQVVKNVYMEALTQRGNPMTSGGIPEGCDGGSILACFEGGGSPSNWEDFKENFLDPVGLVIFREDDTEENSDLRAREWSIFSSEIEQDICKALRERLEEL